jgi:hypothetical protein
MAVAVMNSIINLVEGGDEYDVETASDSEDEGEFGVMTEQKVEMWNIMRRQGVEKGVPMEVLLRAKREIWGKNGSELIRRHWMHPWIGAKVHSTGFGTRNKFQMKVVFIINLAFCDTLPEFFSYLYYTDAYVDGVIF